MSGTTIQFVGGTPDSEVALLYQAAFDRIPDTAGLDYWGSQISAGLSLDSIAMNFIASPEFTAKYPQPDNQTYVADLYQNVLGRAPDPSGQQYWTNQLNSGVSRSQVLIDFSNSQENQNGVTAADAQAVYRVYLATLGRAPDASGLQYWTGQLTSGQMSLQQEAAAFVQSTEFQNKYGALSTAAFVNTLYDNVLAHPGDASGVQYWSDQLNNTSLGRNGVVLGFTQSPEYIAATTAQIANSGFQFA